MQAEKIFVCPYAIIEIILWAADVLVCPSVSILLRRQADEILYHPFLTMMLALVEGKDSFHRWENIFLFSVAQYAIVY